jgi:hypothetical protein
MGPSYGGANNRKWCIATFPEPQQTNIYWTAVAEGFFTGRVSICYQRGQGAETEIAGAQDTAITITNGLLSFSIHLIDGTNSVPHLKADGNIIAIDSVVQGDRISIIDQSTGCRDAIAVVKNFSWNDFMRLGTNDLDFSSAYSGLTDEAKLTISKTITFCLDNRNSRSQSAQLQQDAFPNTGTESMIFTNFHAAHTNLLRLAIPSARSIGWYPWDWTHFHLALEIASLPSSITTEMDSLRISATNASWTTLSEFQNRTAMNLVSLINDATGNSHIPFILSHTYEYGEGERSTYVDPQTVLSLKSGDPTRNIRTDIATDPSPFLAYKGDEDAGDPWLTNVVGPPLQVWQIEFFIDRHGHIELIGSQDGTSSLSAMISDALREQ